MVLPNVSDKPSSIKADGMLKTPDERDLFEKCLKQDRNAQKILYETYFGKMMSVCLRYIKNEEDASEVLNNAFLKVFAKLKQCKSVGNLAGWMKRIVINSSIDFIRRNKAYRDKFILTNEFSLHGSPNESNQSQDNLPDTASQLNHEQIVEMVKELPLATRLVFNLYAIDEFTHKQIAENLKISEGTSRWHLSNARKLLKDKINQVVIKQ